VFPAQTLPSTAVYWRFLAAGCGVSKQEIALYPVLDELSNNLVRLVTSRTNNQQNKTAAVAELFNLTMIFCISTYL
jgi:hypothetical protein